jgi:hypothetical protein
MDSLHLSHRMATIPQRPPTSIFLGAPSITTVFFECFLLLLHTHFMLRPLRAIFRWNIYIYIYTSGTWPRVAVALSGDWLNDIVTLCSWTSLFLPARLTSSPSLSSVFC